MVNDYDKHFKVYMAKALRILVPEYRKQLRAIPFNNLDFQNSTSLILLNFDEESMRKTMYKIHYTIGKSYGFMAAKLLRKENPVQKKKYSPLPLFNEEFQEFLLKYYAKKGGELIVTLSRTMAERVTQDLIAGTMVNETVEQMRDRMIRTVNDPKYYDWMCTRIARTETGFAMNAGKYVAGQVSGVLMEKVWIAKTGGDRRHEHQMMNGQKVAADEYFELSKNVKVRFPCDRDGKGSRRDIGSHVINCTCTYGFEAKRDEYGRLIFID